MPRPKKVVEKSPQKMSPVKHEMKEPVKQEMKEQVKQAMKGKKENPWLKFVKQRYSKEKDGSLKQFLKRPELKAEYATWKSKQ